MHFDARAVRACSSERPFGDASRSAHEMACITPMSIGKGRPDSGETSSHRLSADITSAGHVRTRRRFEDAVISHEGHERIDIVAIPGIGEILQDSNGDLLNHIRMIRTSVALSSTLRRLHEEEDQRFLIERRISLQAIDARIQELGDWRGDMLSRLRALIKQAAPAGCRRMEVEGSSRLASQWDDLHGRDIQERREGDVLQRRADEGSEELFNSSLEGNARRAIDFHEGDKVNEAAFKALIRQAVTPNTR